MWVVDFKSSGRETVSNRFSFYTKYALLKFIGTLAQEGVNLHINIYYDAEMGKRGDNQ